MLKEFITSSQKRQEIIKNALSSQDFIDKLYSFSFIFWTACIAFTAILIIFNFLPQQFLQKIAQLCTVPYIVIVPFSLETVRFILSNKDRLKWLFGILLLPTGSISLILTRYIIISITHVEPSNFPVALSILTFFVGFIIWPSLIVFSVAALLLVFLVPLPLLMMLSYLGLILPINKSKTLLSSLINSCGRFSAIYLLYIIVSNGNDFYLESIINNGKYLTNITKHGLMAINYVPNSQECNNYNEKEWIAKIGDKKISVATPNDTGGIDFTVRNCDKK